MEAKPDEVNDVEVNKQAEQPVQKQPTQKVIIHFMYFTKNDYIK